MLCRARSHDSPPWRPHSPRISTPCPPPPPPQQPRAAFAASLEAERALQADLEKRLGLAKKKKKKLKALGDGLDEFLEGKRAWDGGVDW